LVRAGFKIVNGGEQWIGYWGKHLAAEKFKKYKQWQKVLIHVIDLFPDQSFPNVFRDREKG
jgi:hypothetical protein